MLHNVREGGQSNESAKYIERGHAQGRPNRRHAMYFTNVGIRSKVALVRCESYDRPRVREAVERGLGLLGGPAAFFKPGENIVLKPNLLSAVEPDLCVTTHPSVFEAVAVVLKEFGCSLTYGDSPSGGTAAHAARVAGLAEAAERLSIALGDFDSGRKVTHTSARTYGSFPIANAILEAEGVVSLPKLKTHNFTRFTGAVKNQYGCIPGTTKAQFHARFLMPLDFASFLVDINTFVRPRLCVMDAVVAMEGNGPNTGDLKQLGLLMLSSDPVALDAVACRIIDLDPSYVLTCERGERAGLGTFRAENIEVLGDSVESFRDPSFKVVRKPPGAVAGEGLGRIARSLLAPRPAISHRLCTRCGKCVEICPVEPKALSWPNGGTGTAPRHDYGLCIRCYCCQEACPSRAIRARTPLPGRIAGPLATVGARMVAKLIQFRRWLRRARMLGSNPLAKKEGE